MIPPQPPPLPSVQSHIYSGSNQENRSQMDSMNSRHFTQQHKYQQQQQQQPTPQQPMMYSPTNYSQSHAYNKPYSMKASMSPLIRSPQHPKNNLDQLRLDDGTMRPNPIYEQQQATATNHLKPQYQPNIQIGASNNNFYSADASSLPDPQMYQSLELRRQEIMKKLKQYECYKHAATPQSVNGNGM